MSDRAEWKKEIELRAARTVPADLGSFHLPDRITGPDRNGFARGVTAFRAGDFYLAHDLWEEVWHGYRGADRLFLQGLIHIAVGGYHAQCRNAKGARSQLAKARAKIAPYLPQHWGIDLDRLVALIDDLEREDVHSPRIRPRLDAVRRGL